MLDIIRPKTLVYFGIKTCYVCNLVVTPLKYKNVQSALFTSAQISAAPRMFINVTQIEINLLGSREYSNPIGYGPPR